MEKSAIHAQTQSGLFQLPAEIRNDIYTLVLTVAPTSGTPIELTASPCHPKQPTVLGLLQTCHLINEEAYGIFYSTQALRLKVCRAVFTPTFVFNSMAHLTKTLSKRRLESFREITLTVKTAEECTMALNGLRHLSQLEVVSVDYVHFNGWFQGRLEAMQREASFITPACAKLPRSLKHFHFRILSHGVEWWPAMADEHRSLLKTFVNALRKPVREHGPIVSAPEHYQCSCLWCDPSVETGKAGRKELSQATQS